MDRSAAVVPLVVAGVELADIAELQKAAAEAEEEGSLAEGRKPVRAEALHKQAAVVVAHSYLADRKGPRGLEAAAGAAEVAGSSAVEGAQDLEEKHTAPSA